MATKQISKIFFTQAGPDTNFDERAIPVISFSTDWMDVSDFNQPWQVEVHREFTTGNVKWTLESSLNPDRTDNLAYDNKAINLTIPNAIKDNQMFPLLVRITFTISGAPTGWLTCFLARINKPNR